VRAAATTRLGFAVERTLTINTATVGGNAALLEQALIVGSPPIVVMRAAGYSNPFHDNGCAVRRCELEFVGVGHFG
jgi:hypothetical protein